MRFIVGTVFALGVSLYVVSGFSGIVLVRLKADAPFVADATSCERLASLALPETAVTMAQPVAAGAFTPPAGGRGPAGGGRAGAGAFATLPAFCRVAATLKPTSDSDIKIEVWLPSSGWNGKFQAVGNG